MVAGLIETLIVVLVVIVIIVILLKVVFAVLLVGPAAIGPLEQAAFIIHQQGSNYQFLSSSV